MVEVVIEVIYVPRTARIKSNSGIYHIIMRGINRQNIFEVGEDKEKFIQTLLKYKIVSGFKLYAYCLMDNHLHLLLKEEKEPLETVMRRICGSYVLWYNKKYDRVGYLFQDRFKSEPVENDTYFLTVIRYIFQNPIKAGIVTKVENYKWSNYMDYVEERNITEVKYFFDILHVDRKKSLYVFIDFVNQENDDKCLEITENKRITDEDAKKIIKACCKVGYPVELQTFPAGERNSYIKDLKENHGLSIRQIERLTGISRGIIQRI